MSPNEDTPGNVPLNVVVPVSVLLYHVIGVLSKIPITTSLLFISTVTFLSPLYLPVVAVSESLYSVGVSAMTTPSYIFNVVVAALAAGVVAPVFGWKTITPSLFPPIPFA